MTVSFAVQRFLASQGSVIQILTACAASVLFRKSFPEPMNSTQFPFVLLSDSRYLVLCWHPLSTGSCILCKMIDVDYFYSCICSFRVWPAPFVGDAVFSPKNIFGLSKIRCLYTCGMISGSSVWFHWSMYLFSCQYHADFITVACSITWNLGCWFPKNLFYC